MQKSPLKCISEDFFLIATFFCSRYLQAKVNSIILNTLALFF